jgi:murein DD-endopeptidase MepM/ murein hydrolase activator NlpD
MRSRLAVARREGRLYAIVEASAASRRAATSSTGRPVGGPHPQQAQSHPRRSSTCDNLGGMGVTSVRGRSVQPSSRGSRGWLPAVLLGAFTLLLVGLLGPSASAAVPTGMAPASPGSAWQWPLRPVPNQVVHGFDPPAQRWGSGHRGVDLLSRFGAEVHAARAGVVTFAGVLAGRGVVTVTHGRLRTTYEPVTPAVALGDRVAAGDVIATLDAFGGHCLPRACLHWGLLRGADYLDPLSVVGAGPVRLFPLADAPAPPAQPQPGPVDRSANTPPAAARDVAASPPATAPTKWAAPAAVVGGLAAGGTAALVRRTRSRRGRQQGVG